MDNKQSWKQSWKHKEPSDDADNENNFRFIFFFPSSHFSNTSWKQRRQRINCVNAVSDSKTKIKPYIFIISATWAFHWRISRCFSINATFNDFIRCRKKRNEQELRAHFNKVFRMWILALQTYFGVWLSSVYVILTNRLWCRGNNLTEYLPQILHFQNIENAVTSVLHAFWLKSIFNLSARMPFGTISILFKSLFPHKKGEKRRMLRFLFWIR